MHTVFRIVLRLLVVGVLLAVLVAAFQSANLIPDRHAKEALEGGYPLVGAWLGAWPSDENGLIERFEERNGNEVDIVDVFLDWRTPHANVTHTIAHIMSTGALPMLTWEPRDFTHPEILAGRATISLRDGRTVTIDDYLAEFSEGVCGDAAAGGQPVLVRTLHEMNGDWYPWGIGYSWEGQKPNSPTSFRQAWIKVHDEFASRCGDRVMFVFAMNHFSGAGTKFMDGYPGDDYVDFIGIDGYNWGDRAEWGWHDFNTLFRGPYCAAVGQSSRPVLITETASTEDGGDKAAWVAELFGNLRSGQWPQLRGVVWFDEEKYEIEIKGPMDWPYTTSAAAQQAFRTEVAATVGLREEGSSYQAPEALSVC